MTSTTSEGSWTWPSAPTRSGPLQGVKILDLTRILAGPYATMHLADLGADVIKVENPGHGDETRHWGPPYTDDGLTSYFLAVNHNKRSLTLNLAEKDGAAIARSLASKADVVINNFLPGKMEEFGLSHDKLSQIDPRIISATISGFGDNNIYAGRPGFDFLVQAMGGLMSITGPKDGEPSRVGVAITDLVAGLFISLGIVSVLKERDLKNRGRHVEISLLDSQISMLVNVASGWLTAGVEPKLVGNEHPSIAPYETLLTEDHPIAVAVGTDRQFRRMVEALGVADMADDPKYSSNRNRVENRSAMLERLESVLVQRDRSHWLEHLQSAGVPVAPVNSVREALSDPVVQERMLTTVDGISQIRSPLRIDRQPLEIHTAPPALGADTVSILEHMGLGDHRIRDLVERKVV